MLVRSDARQATGAKLQVPRALAHGVLPSGLTAPALRAFVVMLASADDDGQIDMLKPDLVEWSGTRIDAMHRFLEPIRSAPIDVAAGHEDDGAPWWAEIEYSPGERTKFAGVVRGTLSTEARFILAETERRGTIGIEVDEFRRLTTVPGILVYLRIREELQKSQNAKVINMRAVVEDLHGLFGCYCAAAASKKQRADGEVEMTLGLSRVTATLLRPAIADVARAIDDWEVALQEGKVEGAGRGVRWRHVDIVVGRLAKKKSLKDLIADGKERAAHAERIGRPQR